MPTTKFPRGISSFGVPIFGTQTALPISGDVYFVGNVAGANWVAGVDSPSCGNFQRPFATIDYAIGKCTANQGDVIYVLPGHAENISAAGSITCDVAGISIIGLGRGTKRPTLTWTATAGTIVVSADNVTLANLFLKPTGITAVVTPISLSSTNGYTRLLNLESYFAITSYIALKGLVTATTAASANYLEIDGCYIHGDAVANCTNAIQLVGGAHIKITNNHISGSFTTSLGGINNITAALTDCEISNNIIVNRTASSTVAICLLTGSTGRICDNRLGILSGTAPIVADAVEIVGGNYYKAAVGVAAGTLI